MFARVFLCVFVVVCVCVCVCVLKNETKARVFACVCVIPGRRSPPSPLQVDVHGLRRLGSCGGGDLPRRGQRAASHHPDHIGERVRACREDTRETEGVTVVCVAAWDGGGEHVLHNNRSFGGLSFRFLNTCPPSAIHIFVDGFNTPFPHDRLPPLAPLPPAPRPPPPPPPPPHAGCGCDRLRLHDVAAVRQGGRGGAV